MRWGHLASLPLSIVALAATVAPVRALSITGIAVAPTAANTANLLNNSGANRLQVASTTSTDSALAGPVADLAGASVSFDARYASLLAADREAGGGSTSQSATSAYSITFTVDNPTGGTYRIDIDSSRLGVLSLVDDDSGNATASLGAVVGRLDGVVDAALALAAASLTGASGGSSVVSQSGSTISLLDSALSRTFTLDFTWSSTASSSRDEAAIRLGIAGGLGSTTADNYATSPAGDGHFVNVAVTLLSVPEPGSLPLLALLAAGFALRAGKLQRRPTRSH